MIFFKQLGFKTHCRRVKIIEKLLWGRFLSGTCNCLILIVIMCVCARARIYVLIVIEFSL